MVMEQVMKPHNFDVEVVPNFYDNMLLDLCLSTANNRVRKAENQIQIGLERK